MYNYYSKEDIEMRLSKKYSECVKVRTDEEKNTVTIRIKERQKVERPDAVAESVVGYKSYAIVDNGGLLVFRSVSDMEEFKRTHIR